MDCVSAAAVGAALAMDAAAAAVSCGTKNKENRNRSAFMTAGVFSLFQTLMPLPGWSIGKISSFISGEAGHIPAFLILTFIGVKMIYDSLKDPLSSVISGGKKELFLLAVATSIDALTAGISLPKAVGAYNGADLLLTLLIIGTVTFVFTLSGFYLGSMIRTVRPGYAGIAGGLMLIVIGIKTLFN